MAYDQELAGRIRQLIGSDPELIEKKMFGGLAFLIRGNMAIAASSQGGAMVRVDPARVRRPDGDDEGHACEHARPGHARMVAGQFRRSAHQRPASPLGRDRHRIRAFAAAQVGARRSPGPTAIWSGCPDHLECAGERYRAMIIINGTVHKLNQTLQG